MKAFIPRLIFLNYFLVLSVISKEYLQALISTLLGYHFHDQRNGYRASIQDTVLQKEIVISGYGGIYVFSHNVSCTLPLISEI